MLEGAHAITFDFCSATVYKMYSTIVVVFPVPGGPWIIETSHDFKHFETASF